ncbi:hypothetical protein PCC7424_3700 [Gloeothece citriformis PCC 7424]|uniref:Uncharacterized protein n=1 Tax=Gloeothece citriformis (strain PCC 7424) TaxID=65393 RepID=B7KHY4_GLOC7|nr:hypothetical protein [Gloeothece citriformis]ACK72081.1 hypothetical protein PCC7424_3700 [Gloeothece citriformis PCC 7424]
MIILLFATAILVIVSGWFFTLVFLRMPVYIFHAFDWLFTWTYIFTQIGHWLTLAVFVVILSWFLKE